MASATNNFNESSQIGIGGYGRVYKGFLENGTVVAIKRAEEGSLQGSKEFFTEIEMLSRLHHRNLVSLIGYCDEKDEQVKLFITLSTFLTFRCVLTNKIHMQMLVYEFMANGTVRDLLSGEDFMMHAFSNYMFSLMFFQTKIEPMGFVAKGKNLRASQGD